MLAINFESEIRESLMSVEGPHKDISLCVNLCVRGWKSYDM